MMGFLLRGRCRPAASRRSAAGSRSGQAPSRRRSRRARATGARVARLGNRWETVVHMVEPDASVLPSFGRGSSGNPWSMATRSRWDVRNHGNTAARVVSGVGALFAMIEVVYILLILF